MSDLNDDELLEALGVEAVPDKAKKYTPLQERIIAGFEDIQRFVAEHGRAPLHGEDRDIFERIYAVRLDRLRTLADTRELLEHMDKDGLLDAKSADALTNIDDLDDDDLLAELDVDLLTSDDDIRKLRHVSSHADRQAAEEIAKRKKCPDFDRFRDQFDAVSAGLNSGTWKSTPFEKNSSINVGDFFILGGQIALVAEVLEDGVTKDGRDNPRLRVIFDNQTESDLLLRSLSRSLYPDGDQPVGRCIVKVETLPLFGDAFDVSDVESGTIYILQSRSDHPYVEANRKLIHKIGVTGGAVETRINRAALDATYMLADVDVVATYKLSGINRTKLENLLHRIFSSAQIDVTIQDRFGNPVKPREWFLVPLFVIDEAIERIRNGSIRSVRYDPTTTKFVKADGEKKS